MVIGPWKHPTTIWLGGCQAGCARAQPASGANKVLTTTAAENFETAQAGGYGARP
jgi:hypothetical protein